MCLQIIFNISVKTGLGINQQWLICHKSKPNRIIINVLLDKIYFFDMAVSFASTYELCYFWWYFKNSVF